MPEQTESQQIVDLFGLFLDRDKPLTKELNASHRNCFASSDEWHFTLPGLFEFVQQRLPAFAKSDYKSFRKMLFNSTINKQVSSLGGHISIAQNHQHIDTSVYRLTRL